MSNADTLEHPKKERRKGNKKKCRKGAGETPEGIY